MMMERIFATDPTVEVLAADWSTLRDRGPFSLLFLDSGTPSEVGVDAMADLVEPGGVVVLAVHHHTGEGVPDAVLQQLAAGRSVTEIAQGLSLSVKTVSTHKANLMHKLGLHNPSDLVRYAIRHGLGADEEL